MYKPWTLMTNSPFIHEVFRDCKCPGEAHKGLHESSGAHNAGRSAFYPKAMVQKVHAALDQRLKPSVLPTARQLAAPADRSVRGGDSTKGHPLPADGSPVLCGLASEAPRHDVPAPVQSAEIIQEAEDSSMKLEVKLDEGAVRPKRATEGSAGLDMVANENMVIPARGQASVKTGVHLGMPAGHYGRLASRSGRATWNSATSITRSA